MRGEDGPLTLDLCFSVQADLQHLEFSRERTKPSKHVGSSLPTQGPGPSAITSDLRAMEGRTRLYVVSQLSAIWLPSIIPMDWITRDPRPCLSLRCKSWSGVQ